MDEKSVEDMAGFDMLPNHLKSRAREGFSGDIEALLEVGDYFWSTPGIDGFSRSFCTMWWGRAEAQGSRKATELLVPVRRASVDLANRIRSRFGMPTVTCEELYGAELCRKWGFIPIILVMAPGQAY